MPCHECTKTLLQAGVEQIVIHKQWPSSGPIWEESAKISRQMCKEANVYVVELDVELGVTAYSNGEQVSV